IRPIYVIAPSWTEELGDADWLVHVMHLSEDSYRRNKEYTQDDALISSIKGKGNDSGATISQQQNILRREGINTGSNENQIVLWEVYPRDSGNNIMVDTISPLAGPDKEIRAQFGIPYKHEQFPLVDLRYELVD